MTYSVIVRFCLQAATPSFFRPFAYAKDARAFLAIDDEELACMLDFIHTIHAVDVTSTTRVFSDDCRARITTPLTLLWTLPQHTFGYGEPMDRIGWYADVMRVMRDTAVSRLVRAIACDVVLMYNLWGVLCAQEAADMLVSLYPTMVWESVFHLSHMAASNIMFVGGIDVQRKHARLTGRVNLPDQKWDRLAHAFAPRNAANEHVRKLADQLFGRLLLGFERLETGGVLAVAHSAMLEEMLELVPLQWLRDGVM